MTAPGKDIGPTDPQLQLTVPVWVPTCWVGTARPGSG